MDTIPTLPPKRLGKNGFKYKPKYGLVLVCKDEADQQRQFAKLCKLGYSLKVVCV
nr:hypothetical protein [uncultured Comamonas sp.]